MEEKKILLLEDEIALLDALVLKLNSEGFTTLIAKNGEEGLKVALDNHPDLILLDVIMPGIKGRDLCAKMKSYEVLKNIPVVFLTAKESDDDIQAEMDAGGAAHLTKPVDPVRLLETINSLIK